MRTVVQFTIQKGKKNYIAHANDFGIFTQAETLDGLVVNIREATELHFSIPGCKNLSTFDLRF